MGEQVRAAQQCEAERGLFRWKVNKRVFVASQFKQYQQSRTWSLNGFKFRLEVYPQGLQRSGYVQPYLHLVSMPKHVRKIDAYFSFFFRECSIGYGHVDGFNGKIGKGWPDMKLKFDEIKWADLKSL